MRIVFAAVVLAASFLAAVAAQAAERKVALVIGNGAYTGAGILANTVNDAAAVADKLEALGFEVSLVTDADRRGAIAAIDDFSRSLQGSDVAFLFYAGHGMQIEGDNFLLPVDVDVSSERALRYSAIDIGEVVADMERRARVALVVLDACRDNPYLKSLARTAAEDRGAIPLAGLSLMQLSGRGAIIAYAAAAGEVASDGAGSHSPYTAALLEEIDKRGVEVGLMFRRVAGRVFDGSNGSQRPELLVRLVDEVYLNPAPEAAVATLETATPAAKEAVVVAQAEIAAPAVRSAKSDGFFGNKAIHRPAWADVVTVPAPGAWAPQPAAALAEADGNDGFASAQDLPLDASVTTRIAPLGDVDWFRVSVPVAGELRVSVAASPDNLDLYARLWSADRAVVGDWQGAGRVGGGLDAAFAVAAPGDYWLELTDGSNDAENAAAFEAAVSFVPANDPLEPNNGLGAAQPIPLPAGFAPAIYPRGDADWYRIWVPQPGLLTLRAEKVPDNLDIAMRLWSLDGTVIRDWQVPPRPGGDTVLEAELAEPGIYAIELVDSNNDGESTTTFAFSTLFRPVEDEAEPNGSFGAATLQEPASLSGSKSRRVAIFPLGDADWTAVDVHHPGELKLLATGIPQNLDVYMRVWNANKDVVRDWVGPLRLGGDIDTFADLAVPGRYFIEMVDGNDDASSPELFSFAYAFTPEPDQYEPNNGMAAASPLTPGGEVAFNILPQGDADWFRIEAPSQGELVVELDEGPENLDLYFRVWDADRQVVRDWVAPYRKGGLTEGFADLPRAGVYFIEIVDGNDDARAIEHATLRTMFTATADPLEPNDTFGAAKPVETGGSHAAFILPQSDVDWYALDAKQPGELIVTVDEVDPALDIWVRLWDENGVAGNWFGPPRPGGVTDAAIPVPAAGRYWLELADGNNDARSAKPFRVSFGFR